MIRYNKYLADDIDAKTLAKYNWLPSEEFPGCFQNGSYILYPFIDILNEDYTATRKDHWGIKRFSGLKSEILYIGKIRDIHYFKELLSSKFLDIQDFWDSEERIKELQICNRMELLYKMKYE